MAKRRHQHQHLGRRARVQLRRHGHLLEHQGRGHHDLKRAGQYNTGDDPTSTLLQTCASSSDKFFLLTSANQIIAIISEDRHLSKLRIAQ